MKNVVHLTESDIHNIVYEVIEELFQSPVNEKVFINNVNDKKKQVNLTYTKGRGAYGESGPQQFKNDNLGTALMDQNNKESIEKTIKGNITSYNITDIHGERVMHYFKRYFDHKKATVDVKYQDGQTDTYEMTMLESQFRQFLDQFKTKIGYIVADAVKDFAKKSEITGISIYPVPSSSNFNTAMAQELSDISVDGLPVQIINQNLFNKDLTNLQKDTNFIKKNKKWYNSPFFAGKDSQSLETYVDNYLNQYNALGNAHKYIEQANIFIKKVLQTYTYYLSYNGNIGERCFQNLIKYYTGYCDSINSAIKASRYDNLVDSERTSSKSFLRTIATPLKYTKGPSVEKRTAAIWNLVKPYLRGLKSPVTGEAYSMMDICYWQPTKFQIKNLPNGVRLGLKNIYNVSQDQQLVQEELAKIKGTVFVIFDDNISGGATLGDICYQAKSLGIENIIPITFGRMTEKNSMNYIPLTVPDKINYK